MPRLPPLNALRAFEATARLASVTAAAQELGVSHSAVSQHVRQLEDYFGQKLFDRPGRRVEPTPAATALLEDIRTAFERIAVASEQLTRRGMRKILTVNATQSFAMRWLIPKISSFQDKHPHYEVRVTTSTTDGIAQLDGPYDLIVRRNIMVRPGYNCRLLLDDHATPVMHPKLVKAQILQHPAQLTALPLLHARSHPDTWRRWLLEHGVGSISTLDGPFFDSTSLALQAALHGLGVAIAPMALVSEDLETGRLATPFAQLIVCGPGFHLLYREQAIYERGTREILCWLEGQTGAQLLNNAPQQPTGLSGKSASLAANVERTA